jgi:hypothetical protein
MLRTEQRHQKEPRARAKSKEPKPKPKYSRESTILKEPTDQEQKSQELKELAKSQD